MPYIFRLVKRRKICVSAVGCYRRDLMPRVSRGQVSNRDPKAEKPYFIKF